MTMVIMIVGLPFNRRQTTRKQDTQPRIFYSCDLELTLNR